MAIIGIDTLLYGVEDLARASQFFDDFGLVRLSANDDKTVYRLDEGSTIIVRALEHPSIPASRYEGFGVKETIWGVDNAESLRRLVDDLARDREVRQSGARGLHEGTACSAQCHAARWYAMAGTVAAAARLRPASAGSARPCAAAADAAYSCRLHRGQGRLLPRTA